MYCPKCYHKVAKSGKVWSGTQHKVQRYFCRGCGAYTIRPLARQPQPTQPVPQ